jgi:phage shock protein A
MQVELSHRLERERPECSITEGAAAKQRVCDQLAASQQHVSRLQAEASQLRVAVEEARGAAEEARRGRAALQVCCLCWPSRVLHVPVMLALC